MAQLRLLFPVLRAVGRPASCHTCLSLVVTTLYTAAVRTGRLIKGIPHQFGSLTETTKCPASTLGETRQSFDWRGLALGHQAVVERRVMRVKRRVERMMMMRMILIFPTWPRLASYTENASHLDFTDFDVLIPSKL